MNNLKEVVKALWNKGKNIRQIEKMLEVRIGPEGVIAANILSGDFSVKYLGEQEIKADDGPDSSTVRPGSSHPENWVSQLQSGMTPDELKTLAHTLHDIVFSWLDSSLEAHHAFSMLNMNNGRNFELFSPIILKGMSRDKLLKVLEICTKIVEQAPVI